MPVQWTDSSARHGISREDALHAILHALGVMELTDLFRHLTQEGE